MSIRPIVLLGDPRLRLKGLPVDSFGKPLHELLDDLTETMRHAPGVGLAAPQLGEPLQACVIEVAGQLHELVNPRIVRSDGDDRDLEGCLSIPGFVAYVTRRENASGSWPRTASAASIKVAGTGLLSRALQHELDHLDGKLYIDYLASLDELIPVGEHADEDEFEEAGGLAGVSPDDRTGRRARTVFFGSGSFGLAVFEAALDHASIEVVAVVAAPDRPAGRGPRTCCGAGCGPGPRPRAAAAPAPAPAGAGRSRSRRVAAAGARPAG